MENVPNKPVQPEQSRVARRRAQVRARLLGAAREVFTSRSYQEATISEIVQAADIATGTFYLHFRDKEEVLVALAEEAFQMLRERINTAISQHSQKAHVPLITRTILHMAYEQRDLFLLICAGESRLLTHTHVRRAQEGLAEHFIEALQENSEIDELVSYDAVLLAHLLVGMIIRAINWWFEQDEPGPDVMADHILLLWEQGLPSSLLADRGPSAPYSA